MPGDLEASILRCLKPVVGERLAGATYWCIPGEMTAEAISSPRLYIGGEVELAFAPDSRIIITWDENGGWSDHFSVQVRDRTAFRPDFLEPWPADGAPAWSKHVGSHLSAAAVFGWGDTPHVIQLSFPTGKVSLGCGSEFVFGDGDDLLIRDGAARDELDSFALLWSSGEREA